MDEDLSLKIGARIREARLKTSLNQKALADKVGVTPAAINQLESGKRRPSSTMLTNIAAALDVSTDYLLGVGDSSDIFVGKNVAVAFREFKELGKKDRDRILEYIQFLSSKKK